MLPDWRFLLDRGVNFRTKKELLAAGFPVVYQLADVGLTGLATHPEILTEAQQRRLLLITKDTDFVREARYARGHNDILYIIQSRTELHDTVAAIRSLAHQYPTLATMHFVVLVRGQVTRVP